ncbi:MAG: hypothetical protein ABR549_04205 [Mycobacteriales bacterium]
MTVLTTCALATAVIAGARGTWSPCGLSMVSSINPFSEAARGHRYGVTCAWFVLGALTGGVLLGAGTAVLALALSPLPALGSAVAVGTLAADLQLVRLPVHPRQVEETWLRTFRPWVYGAGFGLQIGVGFATYIMTAATYLLVVLAALTGSPVVAIATGATFGLVRGLAVLLGSGARTPAQLRELHRRLAALAPLSRRVVMVWEAAVAVLLAAAAAPVAGVLAVLLVLLLVGLGRRGPHPVVVVDVLLEPAAELRSG